MVQGALTLFNWTLRMDQRSRWPHLIRGGFALFMMFALATAWLDAFGTTRAGLRFFEAVCYLNIVLITISGISYFVTALTEEKEAGTYALLQMAGMTPLAITLGKSTSRLVSSLLLLVTQLPFAFLAVTLGGLLWQQVIAAWLALAAWLILVANVALLCSARCVTSGRAMALAGLLAMMFFGLPVVVVRTLAALPTAAVVAPSVVAVLEGLVRFLASISPFARIDEILNNWQQTSWMGVQFWGSVIPGGLCFVLSTALLGRSSRLAENGGSESRAGLRRWSAGRCGRLPIAWREFHFFTGGYRFLLVKLLGGGVIFVGFPVLVWTQTGRWDWTPEGDVALEIFFACLGWLTVETLLYASGTLFSEVRQATQSSLAMLPISVTGLLLQKLLGCCVALLPAVIWTLVATGLGWETLRVKLDMDLLLAWGVMLLFSSQVAAVLSLYTRWAALPLTVLCSFVAFFCLVLPILMIPDVVTVVARSHQFRYTRVFAWCVTAFWIWLLVVLPLQLWIRRRWLEVTRM